WFPLVVLVVANAYSPAISVRKNERHFGNGFPRQQRGSGALAVVSVCAPMAIGISQYRRTMTVRSMTYHSAGRTSRVRSWPRPTSAAIAMLSLVSTAELSSASATALPPPWDHAPLGRSVESHQGDTRRGRRFR